MDHHPLGFIGDADPLPLEKMTHRASACGKIILLGEHAAVYGFPAIAIPFTGLRARAELSAEGSPFRVDAPDIGLNSPLRELPADHPLAFCVRRTCEYLGRDIPAARLTITSEIPVASGLGSGAAVSTAIVRVLASSAGRSLSPAETSQIVFETEKIHHGNPSGVDNTVIAYERPVYFRRDQPPGLLALGSTMLFVVADSGIRSSTKTAVGGVGERRAAQPEQYDSIFQKIGALAEAGRRWLSAGEIRPLGEAMNECHGLLRVLGVSLPALDRLVDAARSAGALGGKLTGAGLGGNIVALVEPQTVDAVADSLRSAGAAAVYRTVLAPGDRPSPPMK
jgi:mevalonate kinase